MKAGVQAAAHAFERNEGLDEQRKVCRQRQMVLAQDGGYVRQHLRQIKLCQRRAVVLVDEHFYLAFELTQMQAFVVASPVHQHISHGLRVTLDQAEQKLQQFLAPVRRQSADHAKVDKRDVVAGQVEDVAGVRISMKKTIFHNHFQHRLGAAPGQQGAVKPGLQRERGQFAAGDATDKVLRVDAFAGVRPVHARNDDVGHSSEVGGDAFGVAAFGGQVQLAPQGAGKFLHQLAQAVGFEGR